jgi:hypothetical protein
MAAVFICPFGEKLTIELISLVRWKRAIEFVVFLKTKRSESADSRKRKSASSRTVPGHLSSQAWSVQSKITATSFPVARQYSSEYIPQCPHHKTMTLDFKPGHEPVTQADFTYWITPTTVSVTDTRLGRRAVTGDIEAFLAVIRRHCMINVKNAVHSLLPL